MKLKSWRDIRNRLAAMDRSELRDRIQQEVAKRQDGILAHLGYGFVPGSKHSTPVRSGNFFFSSDSVDAILALVRERLPGRMGEIVNQADRICRHRFDLLGYEDLDYGSPIEWHLDAVHRKHAPRKLFYKVRYLDFEEVGDSKVTWELNRHQHLVTLAKAYRLTGDTRYSDEILRQWRHWQLDNPYPIGINWASSLEVSFRCLSWIWTYHLLGGPGLSGFRKEWLRGLSLHGRHIERYLSTYFSPNTHLLGEGVGLFFLGVLCPELAAAERWKALGWQTVLREADRQVQADGFHFEQSTYYHVYALDFFLHSAILANVNNIPIPESLEKTLDKMLAALCLLGRAGPVPQFGDDDGGRLFDPRRNRNVHLFDPLAAGAILFHRGEYKSVVRGLREEAIWLLGVEGVRRWDSLKATPLPMDSAALPAAGFYLLTAPRSATQLVLQAGPQGTQSGGHAHASALSVCLQSQGGSLLLDPGTYEYIGLGGDRERFRSTAMHNTLRVDSMSQSETVTPFSWRRLTQSKVEQWIQSRDFDLLVASHDGYQRLGPPVTHRRWVLSLKSGVYLVRDVVAGQGSRQLDISWHLGNDLELGQKNVFRAKGAPQGLALLPLQGHGWTEEIREETCAPVYGQKAPMTVLNFGTVTTLPAEFAILLVTLEEADRNPGSFVRIGAREPHTAVRAYQYLSEDTECSFWFGEAGKPWQQDGVSSDAGFVCWRRKPTETLIMVNGTCAAIEGGPAFRSRRNVAWGQVIVQASGATLTSSDPEAVQEEAVASDQPR